MSNFASNEKVKMKTALIALTMALTVVIPQQSKADVKDLDDKLSCGAEAFNLSLSMKKSSQPLDLEPVANQYKDCIEGRTGTLERSVNDHQSSPERLMSCVYDGFANSDSLKGVIMFRDDLPYFEFDVEFDMYKDDVEMAPKRYTQFVNPPSMWSGERFVDLRHYGANKTRNASMYDRRNALSWLQIEYWVTFIDDCMAGKTLPFK